MQNPKFQNTNKKISTLKAIMRNKLSQLFAALFLSTLILSSSVRADDIFRFTKITCIPELNYFDVSAFDIHSDSDKESDSIISKKHELTKYGIMIKEEKKTRECKLKNSLIKLEVQYRDPETSGIYFCKSVPPSILKIWVDNLLIAHLKSFNDCSVGEEYSVKSVDIKLSENGGLRIGLNAQASDRLNPNFLSYDNYKKINLVTNKNEKRLFPIKDNYITQSLTNKK